jgi:hypothetical protein
MIALAVRETVTVCDAWWSSVSAVASIIAVVVAVVAAVAVTSQVRPVLLVACVTLHSPRFAICALISVIISDVCVSICVRGTSTWLAVNPVEPVVNTSSPLLARNVWKWSRAAFHVFCASGNTHQRWHASDSRLLVLTIVQLASVLIPVESGATERKSFSCVFDLLDRDFKGAAFPGDIHSRCCFMFMVFCFGEVFTM